MLVGDTTVRDLDFVQMDMEDVKNIRSSSSTENWVRVTT